MQSSQVEDMIDRTVDVDFEPRPQTASESKRALALSCHGNGR